MTELNPFLRLILPQRDRSGSAARPNRTQRRLNAQNPELPRERESLGDYLSRSNGNALASTSNRGAVLRQEQRDQTAVVADRMSLDRSRQSRGWSRPRSPGALIGEGAVEIYNAQSMRLVDIPMGVESAFPRLNKDDGDPPLATTGGNYASGYRTDEQGRPTELITERIDWHSPERRAGLVIWGTDLRRPEADIFREVERRAGGPDGLANVISLRESNPRIRQYDQGGPDTTSAQGPHQFTAGTWRTWIRGIADEYGVPINFMTDEEVQELRYDARFSAAATLEMARFHAAQIARDNPGGPAANAAELYLMHHGGGDEGGALVNAHRRGDTGLALRFYSRKAIANHMNDFYVDGNIQRPRSTPEYFAWMTGNAPGSPHRRRYYGDELTGISLEPVQFGARANGTTDTLANPRPGVVLFDRSSQ